MIETLLKVAGTHFTAAQKSTTPGVADAVREALAEFQTLQYSRGYGGVEADRMRAIFPGAIAITAAGDLGRMGAAAAEDCKNRQFGAAMAQQGMPTC